MEGGELAHLFVLAGRAISGDVFADGLERGRVGSFATLTWREGGLLVLAASELPAERLEALLREPLAVASRGFGGLGLAASW